MDYEGCTPVIVKLIYDSPRRIAISAALSIAYLGLKSRVNNVNEFI